MSKKHYLINCISAEGDDIRDMIDVSTEITRKTFLSHVDRFDMVEIERGLGYAIGTERGLHMAKDWAVRYYKSTYKGQPCVYFDHSCIEYVWV